MTPELLQKMASNPKMMEGFRNPEVMKAIAMLQTDPEAAKQKYKHDAKITEFIIEFSKIMGGHFESIGEEEKKKAA